MLKMQENGWLGAKSGQGFFLKKKDKDGSTIYELNPETFEYEDRKKLKTAATEMAKQAKGSRNKLKALVSAQGDKAGDLVWSVVKPVLIYSAELLGEIADDIVSIDEAKIGRASCREGRTRQGVVAGVHEQPNTVT